MKALICGTKVNSTGRRIGEALLRRDWEVFVYSREDGVYNTGRLHVRHADVTKENDLERLLVGSGKLDLVIVSADAGDVFGEFEHLEAPSIRSFLETKIFGSVLLLKRLLASRQTCKVVFMCGSRGKKGKDLWLYGIANAALMALVETINDHYADTLEAYYLETPVIRDSPKEKEYCRATGRHTENLHASALMEPLLEIVDGSIPPGFVAFSGGRVI